MADPEQADNSRQQSGPSRPPISERDPGDSNLLTDLFGKWDDERPLTGARRIGLVVLSMILALLIVVAFILS